MVDKIPCPVKRNWLGQRGQWISLTQGEVPFFRLPQGPSALLQGGRTIVSGLQPGVHRAVQGVFPRSVMLVLD